MKQKIIDSDLRFRKLIENSYSGITLLDEQFNIVYRSPSVERINGWNNEERLKIMMMDMIHPDDSDRILTLLQEVLVTPGLPMNCSFRTKHFHGHYIWLECTFTNMLQEPEVETIVCNFRDITEKKRAEEVLQQTINELYAYKYALDESAIVAITDQKGIIKHVNHNFCKISKYSAEELIGQDHRIINSLYHDKAFIKDLWNTIANGEIWKGELKNKAKDDTCYWVDTTIVPFLNEDGKPYQYIAIRSDITERKTIEQKNIDNERHLKLLESVITNTTDAVLITEAMPLSLPGPRILYVNEAFTKMTGYSSEEIIGETPRILQGPKSDKKELQRLSDALKKWEPCEITTINYKKNGEEFWINFSLNPVADENGWYTHWIAIERDVTKKKNEELHKELISKISSIFNFQLTLEESLAKVLEQLTDFGNLTLAEVWLISEDKKRISLSGKFFRTDNAQVFYDESREIKSFANGEGLPGVTWATKTRQRWEDIDENEDFIRNSAAKKAGLKTAYGLPLYSGNGIIGVLVLGLSKEEHPESMYTALFEDLSTHLGAEIKRKLLEQELNQIFNFAPDIICITGTDGYHKKINPAMCVMLGYTEEEILTRPFIDFVHPADKEKTFAELESLTEGKPTYYFENRYISKSGVIKWLAWTTTPSSEDGLLFCVAKDITDKKDLEDAVKEVLEERNTILESIGDAFFAVDKNWVVTYWNSTAATVLSKSKTEMLSHNIWEAFKDAIGSESYLRYHEAVETNQAVHFEDYYAPLNKWYEISAYPSGNGLSVYFKDITDRKLFAERLIVLNQSLQAQTRELTISNAELEQFAYVASHDLQEPLRMVTSFLTQLERRYGEAIDDKGKLYIHFAVDGAKRMRQIILDLLEFSRVGRTEDNLEKVNLNKLTEDILALFRKQIEEKQAVLIINDLPTLLTYKPPVRQIFQNLIGNSLKYSKTGTINPVINIGCEDHVTHWQFYVKDNGIGIDPEYFDRIFIIFQRLHNKDEYSGTGMGLAVTKKIVENWGGKIWVESAEGQGSTFYFTILKNKEI